MTTQPDFPPGKQPQDRANLRLRLITALVGAPLALGISYAGGWLFAVLVMVVGGLALLEFYALGRSRQSQGVALVGLPTLAGLLAALAVEQYALAPALLAVAFAGAYLLEGVRRATAARRLYRALTTAAGLAYVGLPSAFLIALRARPDGFDWLALALALTWGTDTLAYAGGRLLGRRLLAPRISPKKTVEGALVGAAGGFVCGLAWAAAAGLLRPALLPLLALAPLAAVAGDLFESRIKRFFHAGDSHLAGFDVLPGHGGILDRIDSLIWVVPLCYAFARLLG